MRYRVPPIPLLLRNLHSSVAISAMSLSSSGVIFRPLCSPNIQSSPSPVITHCTTPLLFGGGLFISVRQRNVNSIHSTRLGLPNGVYASQRGFRKIRGGRVSARKKHKGVKELELDVRICIEQQLPDDPEILDIAEMLRLNVPMAMKLAFDGLKDSDYKTRDPTINDVGQYESVELSILLCNDEFIRELNKDWRNEDHATDVLSMSQHVPELKLPMLMMGDIIVSVETAARQAEERGHSLLDEIRILMVRSTYTLFMEQFLIDEKSN